MEKPALLVLTTTYPRWQGDTEPPFVHKLCTHLLQEFRVLVLAPHTPSASTAEVIDGVMVRRYRYWLERWQALAYQGGLVANLKANRWRIFQLPLLLLAQIWTIRQIVQQEQVDVIHAHWIIPQGLAVRLALLGLEQQPRWVCTSHGGDLLGFDGFILRALKRWVLRRADTLTAVSETIANKARDLDIGPLTLQVIPMGIEMTQMKNTNAGSRANAEILFVGRLVEKKGLPYLLDAMALLHQSGRRTELTIVGDGPLRQELHARCRQLGLESSVRFLGALANDQLPRHYSRATIFAAPSVITIDGDQEGLPVTLMEALACRCPVVASALGGISEVVKDEVSGLLVAPGNAKALAGALERMLGDPALRTRLANTGHDWVHGRLDWSIIARRYAEALRAQVNPAGMQTVCAVVVAYYPDDQFPLRLQNLAGQVAGLVVVDNTPPTSRKMSITLPRMPGGQWVLVEHPDNLGVATALNKGLKQAREWGCSWLLTLDQDSSFEKDGVQSLLATAARVSSSVIVIGGNYMDTRNGRTKVASGPSGKFLEQKTVITSASLVRVDEALRLGGFREDYFIDQLDHEFCLRVRKQGGKVVITRKVVMQHSVGEAGGVRFPLLGTLPRHPPRRKYFITRNTCTTVAEYWKNEPVWCLKRITRLLLGAVPMILLEDQRLPKARAFLAGLRDAWRSRLGPAPPDL